MGEFLVNGIESAVIEHYDSENMLPRILQGLADSGADMDHLQPADLMPVEEFHTGGRQATEYLVARLSLSAQDHVLDVGCGIGGAARFIAGQTGGRVTGIDLTPEFIDVANVLSERVRLSDQLQFEAASALSMPFADAKFDAAITIHVAMNIHDRESFYGEIARVMKPGSLLGVFDIMRNNDDDLVFPLPWAQSAATSHLITAQETADRLTAAGFTVTEIEDRTDFALKFFSRSVAQQASGPPPLGVHTIMGDTAREKFSNVFNCISNGIISPTQIIATRNS
jgi:ubiquinone/menaquinone biosynthesis C-methylase UbiE